MRLGATPARVLACDSARVRLDVVVGLLALGACSSKSGLDEKATAGILVEVPVKTAHGLSGLAADAQGRLWTVSERAERAYRITLDAANTPAIETFTITGAPDDTDLEGIEELGGDRFAFGTEGRTAGLATILLGELRDRSIAITSTITLSNADVGIELAKNHGAEGICGGGDTIIAAIEGAGVEGEKRWAPVLRLEHGALAQRYRVWLTSTTGKLSGLDCTIAADGTAEVWAIERHFEVTRILAFTLPPTGGDITPRIALDLAMLGGKRNLEGIAQLTDGRIVTVSDNQWKTIEGPSYLQVFAPGAVK